jgi:hypothetical protein
MPARQSKKSVALSGAELDTSRNADQAEALAIERGITAIADSAADERISGQIDERDSDWWKIDERAEQLEGPVREQLTERSTLLDGAYPFEVVGGAIRYKPSRTGVYEFLLLTSLADHSGGENQELQVAFEQLSAKLVAQLFNRGDYFRTGWPSNDDGKRPFRLKSLSKKLEAQSGEWKWNPMFKIEDDPDPKDAKDGGLDFVSWARFDTRPGSLFIAGQCACGRDWRNKLSDLNDEKLARWWTRPTYNSPVRCFSTPHAIPGDDTIAWLTMQAGIFLDRCRLTLLAEQTTITPDWLKSLRSNSVPTKGATGTKMRLGKTTKGLVRPSRPR